MPETTGNIYDLGYRRYEGVRLGRRHAISALYWHSLKGIFGIGRGPASKLFPMALAIITLIPAVVQLAIAALASGVVELYSADNYYGYIEWPLALFVAAVAPEVVGRDQKTRVLTLYFSRSLLRRDYVVAKAAALVTALLLLTLVPQAVLMVGNAFSKDDTLGYFQDNWKETFPIVASGLLLAAFFASIGLAIACQTARRAYATGGILAYFAVGTFVGAVLVEAGDGPLRKYGLLASGFHIVRGFTLWVFDVTPTLNPMGESDGPAGDLALAGLNLGWYAAVAAAISLLGMYVVYRRYRRLSV